MIDASGSWGVLRIFVDPQELKASKMPKMTIVIEFIFFIVLCLNFSINVQQVVLLFQKAIRPIPRVRHHSAGCTGRIVNPRFLKSNDISYSFPSLKKSHALPESSGCSAYKELDQ